MKWQKKYARLSGNMNSKYCASTTSYNPGLTRNTTVPEDCDILISGGGAAGLLATAALADRGLKVICCTPESPRQARSNDNRITALLNPSIEYLEKKDIWSELARCAVPMNGLVVVDALHGHDQLRVDFRPGEFGLQDFGHVVSHAELLARLEDIVAGMPGIQLHHEERTFSVLPRTGEVMVRMHSGKRYRAKLVIAADGRNSAVRNSCGIAVRKHGFSQSALTFNVTHDDSHENKSIEVHDRNGPFTLVPVPDCNDSHQSSVVWMDTRHRVWELASMSSEQLGREATRRSGGLLGDLEVVSTVKSWPIHAQHAVRIASERCVLIGEAAHVVPPIGAQGFNMSIADIAELDMSIGSHLDPGCPAVIERYARKRKLPVLSRWWCVLLLNHLSIARTTLTQQTRRKLISITSRGGALRELLVTGMSGKPVGQGVSESCAIPPGQPQHD